MPQLTNNPINQLTNNPTNQLTNNPTNQLTNKPTNVTKNSLAKHLAEPHPQPGRDRRDHYRRMERDLSDQLLGRHDQELRQQRH
ncbi:MAG: PT domain-containing protein [Saprospiraceae bacterium]|nr:PT domain-containing protein [Saprospiraceae bacterium]